ncbi:glycosyltransferase family 2 protein [candidate division TA06 bacterium]|uniref:Glycosyltransferase family 2 protein n=1 Tax=candidate division TA06 bacterium TaxID=2250710 RepID=A0A933IAA0_UNCT6|nr:glycosyltransferase family 2 protein [candidate division TA06 bacterium]
MTNQTVNNDPAPVSILVITRNEERNISSCLESLGWATELVVLDSFSTDATVSLAEKYGARVFQRQFDNFASHKNWAIDHIDFKNRWLLIVDADERVSLKLAREIESLLAAPSEHNGYYIARQNIFAGKWIRFGGWYPDWQLRLIKIGKARYENRIVHEHMMLEGSAGFLKNPLVHYDYKGIERYFNRHNTYSSMEAVEIYRSLNGLNNKGIIPEGFLSKGPARRRFLKNFAYRHLFARPLFKFIWMYFLKFGFLDGRIGFRFSMLHAFYDYQISLKLNELKDKNSPLYEKYKEYIEK